MNILFINVFFVELMVSEIPRVGTICVRIQALSVFSYFPLRCKLNSELLYVYIIHYIMVLSVL